MSYLACPSCADCLQIGSSVRAPDTAPTPPTAEQAVPGIMLGIGCVTIEARVRQVSTRPGAVESAACWRQWHVDRQIVIVIAAGNFGASLAGMSS